MQRSRIEVKADRSNHRLNVFIEDMIRQWEGTAFGVAIRNMYENGCTYESICDVLGEDYADWEE